MSVFLGFHRKADTVTERSEAGEVRGELNSKGDMFKDKTNPRALALSFISLA